MKLSAPPAQRWANATAAAVGVALTFWLLGQPRLASAAGLAGYLCFATCIALMLRSRRP